MTLGKDETDKMYAVDQHEYEGWILKFALNLEKHRNMTVTEATYGVFLID